MSVVIETNFLDSLKMLFTQKKATVQDAAVDEDDYILCKLYLFRSQTMPSSLSTAVIPPPLSGDTCPPGPPTKLASYVNLQGVRQLHFVIIDFEMLTIKFF